MKTLQQFDKAKIEARRELAQRFECACEKTELRERTIANGSLQVVHQCLRCGNAVGNPVKRSTVQGEIPKWDQCLRDNYVAEGQAAREEVEKKFGREAFHDAYGPYLSSPEWASKRNLVFRRANGICEGCGSREPNEVHHLTYAHVGDEFLFELVALCTECHDRIHQEE